MRLLELFADVGGVDDEFLLSRRRRLVHGVDHHGLDDGAESAGAELVFNRLVDNQVKGVVGICEFHAVELEDFLILSRDGVLRLDEDAAQGVAVERVEARQHRQTADDLWDDRNPRCGC